jgi:hypothetical protein
MSVVYDTGVFIAAERNDRDVWADHRARLELGLVPQTTAPVVALVSRSPRQVQLRRILRGCDIVPFRPDESHDVGALLAKAGTADVVDAHVVVTAAVRSAVVLTSDLDDLLHLAGHLPAPVQVRHA